MALKKLDRGAPKTTDGLKKLPAASPSAGFSSSNPLRHVAGGGAGRGNRRFDADLNGDDDYNATMGAGLERQLNTYESKNVDDHFVVSVANTLALGDPNANAIFVDEHLLANLLKPRAADAEI